MRYTPEQYQEMVEVVESYLLEAENHVSRIVKRLDGTTQDEVVSRAFFEILDKKIIEVIGILHSLTSVLDTLE